MRAKNNSRWSIRRPKRKIWEFKGKSSSTTQPGGSGGTYRTKSGSFGPRKNGPNILVNKSEDFQNWSVDRPRRAKPKEASRYRDLGNSIVSGFPASQFFSGPMCEEPPWVCVLSWKTDLSKFEEQTASNKQNQEPGDLAMRAGGGDTRSGGDEQQELQDDVRALWEKGFLERRASTHWLLWALLRTAHSHHEGSLSLRTASEATATDGSDVHVRYHGHQRCSRREGKTQMPWVVD